MLNRNLFSLILFFYYPFLLYGQKFVSDSLVVDFGNSSLTKINAVVDTVIDQRKLAPNCIAITEKKKYFKVPIDYRILTSKPLRVGFSEMFSNKSDSTIINNIRLEIKEFVIKSESNFLKEKYTCDAIISVYSVKKTNIGYIGALSYEFQGAEFKSIKHPQIGYEVFIDSWKTAFIADMNAIILHSSVDTSFSLPNLIKVSSDFRKNMILSTEVAIGLDSWLIDGEIMFSRPEPQPEFYRQGYILRFRREKRYESIEFSISNKQYNYRLNNNFVFVFKPKLFWGLNYWNKNEYSKHGLEDVFLFDFSATQSILYNPFYKTGIVCGLGIMENATYIYSEPTKVKPYIVFQISIKL